VQTLCCAEYGASHVIMMDLSHSVDDVVKRNLVGLKNLDVIQYSIDAPPLRDQCIDGIVYCHNVIQHTPPVEKTTHAIYALTKPGGEILFNCYGLNDQGVVRWVRFNLAYKPLRAVLSRMPFAAILFYARLMAMALLSSVPGLGVLLEKSGFCAMGDVHRLPVESALCYLLRRLKILASILLMDLARINFSIANQMTRFARWLSL
jgi:hypothetical protein